MPCDGKRRQVYILLALTVGKSPWTDPRTFPRVSQNRKNAHGTATPRFFQSSPGQTVYSRNSVIPRTTNRTRNRWVRAIVFVTRFTKLSYRDLHQIIFSRYKYKRRSYHSFLSISINYYTERFCWSI